MTKINLLDLGTQDYGATLDIQMRLVEEVQGGKIPSTLIIVEHPDVITLGKRSNDKSLFIPPNVLKERNIDVFHIDRGGEATCHGHGQIVLYPIFHLDAFGKSIRSFVERLEQVFIDHLRDNHQIDAISGTGEKTGVWVGDKKITAIGLGVRRKVTYHGAAYNVNTDLSLFDLINPCGLGRGTVTSLSKLLDKPIDFNAEKQSLLQALARTFAIEFDPVEKPS